MIEKSHQDLHELVVSEHQGKRQSNGVSDYGYHGFCNRANPEARILQSNSSPQQSSLQHESTRPTDRRNDLIHYSLVAPDEYVSLFDHSSKKVRVPPPVKLWIERRLATVEKLLFQQHVPG